VICKTDLFALYLEDTIAEKMRVCYFCWYM